MFCLINARGGADDFDYFKLKGKFFIRRIYYENTNFMCRARKGLRNLWFY